MTAPTYFVTVELKVLADDEEAAKAVAMDALAAAAEEGVLKGVLGYGVADAERDE